MWDPNAVLGHWPRDDDVLSWRSLDTWRGVDALGDSDASDPEELAEVVDRRSANAVHHSVVGSASATQSGQEKQWRWAGDAKPMQANTLHDRSAVVQHRESRARDDRFAGELPSTSEMMGFRESEPVFPREFEQLKSEAQFGHLQPSVESHLPEINRTPPRPAPVVQQPSSSLPPRVTMTLGDLLTKRSAGTPTMHLSLLPSPPSPPHHVPSSPQRPTVPPPASVDAISRVQDLRALERQCEELADRERHLQTVLAKQLHQLETMLDQMQQQDAKYQAQQLELSGLREQLTRLERQNATLQATLKEKEQAQEQHTQLLIQKTAELNTVEVKARSLQITNETYQEQARKATEEKEKVHKDYLQVVYDLGKLQKQLNANAKETVNVAEKDLLLREIDQLRHEKDQLAAKLKESEARKSSLMHNNAAVEAHKTRELQGRIRELEEDLSRARNGKLSPQSAVSVMQPPLRSGLDRSMQGHQIHSQDFHRSVSFDTSASSVGAWNQPEQLRTPSLMASMTSNTAASRPMTLKDMMGDRRPPADIPSVSSSTANGPNSLASLGYSSADRRPTVLGFNYDQLKAGGALPRHGTSIGDVLRQQAALDPSECTPVVDPALSAPFATEKQSLLQDSLQRRDLEHKLLKLHVEKEQMEAKLSKVEQTGLKTMSARTEKAWLESRLRDLSLEVSRLRLSLRG